MKTPLLILLYNRPNVTKTLFNKIKKMKPSTIYIAADGPRANDPVDSELCNRVRNIFSKINWNCKIYRKYNKKNFGCKNSITKSIDWFFKREKYGIILEDDCIPSLDFFWITGILLKKYENNNKIFCISGSNYTKNFKNDNNSYYFSKYPHCWGWATWRRAWRKNDPYIKFWPKFKNTLDWKSINNSITENRYWNKIFDRCYKGKFNSWAYPWTLSVWKNKGLTIIPKENLVKNIGYGTNSTNSFFRDIGDIYKTKKIQRTIKHPKLIRPDVKKDNFVFNNHYRGKNYLYPYRIVFLIKMFISNPLNFLKRAKNTLNQL
tara:strand:- start:491 stop:1447 length:957 start_codon:yes stop_codon:yes gene_type:complete